MSEVSFVITSYNYSKYIEECLESIINQDKFDSNKIIIIDDGSTDETYIKIKRYLSMPCIDFIQIENSGVEVASNLAIDQINTNYFTRVDADDSLKSNFLSIFNDTIDVYNNSDFIYSNYSVIDESSIFVKEVNLPEFSNQEIFQRGDFLATGTIYKKDSFNLVGKYDTNVKNCGLENYSLILRLITNNFSGRMLPYSLFNYRIHSGNMSKKRRKSIIEFGNELTRNLLNRPYEVNFNHPYGLKLD